MPKRIHAANTIPHFDAFGETLAFCKRPGVCLRELGKDIKAWRGWIQENRTRIRSSLENM